MSGKAWLVLAAVTISNWNAAANECPDVETAPNFEASVFFGKRWYIHQTMETIFLHKEKFRCMYEEYHVLPKWRPWNLRKNLWGYDINIVDYSRDSKGTPDTFAASCIKKSPERDPAKFKIGQCATPRIPGLVGPYWVLAHDEGEGYALLTGGSPKIKTEEGCQMGSGIHNAGMWLLSRSQERNETLIGHVRGIATSKRIDVRPLLDVDQTGCDAPAPSPAPAKLFRCKRCSHFYDPEKDGDGAAFDDLPSDWKCPVCGAPKSAYKKVAKNDEALYL